MTDLSSFSILLVLYSICTASVVVWSTLLEDPSGSRWARPRGGIEFAAISCRALFKRAPRTPNLVVFDLHLARGIGASAHLTSGWLPVAESDLPCLLPWLPPASEVVFCCREAALRLGPEAKAVLAERGIRTVYFLDESHTLEPSQPGAPAAASRSGESSHDPQKCEVHELTGSPVILRGKKM